MGESLQRINLLTAMPADPNTAEGASQLHGSWLSYLDQCAAEAKSAQEAAENWGTGHNPDSIGIDLPAEGNTCGYEFQKYLILKLLATHEYHWNSPLYESGVAT